MIKSVDFKSLAIYMSKVLGSSTGAYITGTNLKNIDNYENS